MDDQILSRYDLTDEQKESVKTNCKYYSEATCFDYHYLLDQFAKSFKRVEVAREIIRNNIGELLIPTMKKLRNAFKSIDYWLNKKPLSKRKLLRKGKWYGKCID